MYWFIESSVAVGKARQAEIPLLANESTKSRSHRPSGSPLLARVAKRARMCDDGVNHTLRDFILAKPRNTYEKMKRDSDKRRKSEEKRESKRLRKASKQTGGPAGAPPDPHEVDTDGASP